MLREIVLDTETTGLDPAKGDRIAEIACIELLNRIPTGREFQCFVNPERDMPKEAEAVHGLSTAFLKDKPLFKDVVEEFLGFIEDAQLVIHNASFDVGFLNFELGRVGKPPILMDRVVDTLALARRKHPGGPNSLDGLCKRYQIDNAARVKHGALIDTRLLAQVYLELTGERQAALGLTAANAATPGQARAARVKPRPKPLAARLSAEEAAQHHAFVETLGEGAIWKTYAGSKSGKTAG